MGPAAMATTGDWDVCGCPPGMGWSSSQGGCREGSTTSGPEECAGMATATTGDWDVCGCGPGMGWCSSQDPPGCGQGCTTSGPDECGMAAHHGDHHDGGKGGSED